MNFLRRQPVGSSIVAVNLFTTKPKRRSPMHRYHSSIHLQTLVPSTFVIVLAAIIIPVLGAPHNAQKAMPDLIVKIHGPSAAIAGDDIGPSIHVLARNIGTATAPGTSRTLHSANRFMIDLVLSTDANLPPGFATFSPHFSEDVLLQGGRISNTVDLAAGANKAYPTGGGIPSDTPTGYYYICARIDPGSRVAEANEANNVSCSRIRIRGGKKPDLLTRLSAPASATSGSDIGPSVKLVAYNAGTAPAPGTSGPLEPANSYMIDLVLSTDDNVPPGFANYSPHFSEDVLLQGGRTSNTVDLAAGANKAYPTGGGIPSDTPTGYYYICARIDP